MWSVCIVCLVCVHVRVCLCVYVLVRFSDQLCVFKVESAGAGHSRLYLNVVLARVCAETLSVILLQNILDLKIKRISVEECSILIRPFVFNVLFNVYTISSTFLPIPQTRNSNVKRWLVLLSHFVV